MELSKRESMVRTDSWPIVSLRKISLSKKASISFYSFINLEEFPVMHDSTFATSSEMSVSFDESSSISGSRETSRSLICNIGNLTYSIYSLNSFNSSFVYSISSLS